MKLKFLISTLLTTITITVYAQPRIAVLNFNAGVHVNQSDVDGLSDIFNTCFMPIGYTVVERTLVSRLQEEHHMQSGKLTEKDMVKLGEILNVPVVVIGTVNQAMGQYNIDVRAVNVETGAIVAKDGTEWTVGSSYRETMCNLAERISKNIPIIEITKPQKMVEVDTTPKPRKIVPLYRPEGWYLQPELGAPTAISIGNQITSSFSVFGGIAIAPLIGIDHRTSPALPIFAGIRYSTPKYKFSMFADIRLGIDLQDQKFLTPKKTFIPIMQVGCMWKELSVGIGVTMFYDEQWDSSYYESGLYGSGSISISYRIPVKAIKKRLF